MITKYGKINNGLTSEDFKFFNDLVIKANDEQVVAMMQYIIKECGRRKK